MRQQSTGLLSVKSFCSLCSQTFGSRFSSSPSLIHQTKKAPRWGTLRKEGAPMGDSCIKIK